MVLDKKSVLAAVEKCLSESKGRRKFTQSIDLAINFRDVDFKKPVERLNVDVVLPFQPKSLKVAVFADGALSVDAQKAGAEFVFAGAAIPSFATDKVKQKQLLECAILASPQLMASVGKAVGQLLATKGRLPKPVTPGSDLRALIERTRRTITLRSKGKNLPCVHCIVGTESMPVEQVTENILAVLEAVEKKVSEPRIKSVFVKTTMGKPVKIERTSA